VEDNGLQREVAQVKFRNSMSLANASAVTAAKTLKSGLFIGSQRGSMGQCQFAADSNKINRIQLKWIERVQIVNY
jgi:hypothetical protein